MIVLLLFWFGFANAFLRGSNVHEDIRPFLGTWNVLYSRIGNDVKKKPNCEKIYYYMDDSLQFRYLHSKKTDTHIWHTHYGNIHLDQNDQNQLNIKDIWRMGESVQVRNEGMNEKRPFFQKILYMDEKKHFMITSDEKFDKFHILTRPQDMVSYTNREGMMYLNIILEQEGMGSLEDFHQIDHSYCYSN